MMFTGSIVAMITPMHSNGDVDKISLRNLINYHIAAGTSAIVAMGTTGESATLTHAEHIQIVKEIVALADGQIPIIAGTGSNSTAEAIALTESFNDSGVVGCLTVTPYYNKPTAEGLYQHFKAIALSTDLPQILYNEPGRTGCDLKPDTVARLAEIPNIVGLKEATGDLSRVSELTSLVDEDFILLSGDDATALDFMRLGGHGVISVTANIAAKTVAEICALCAKGDFQSASQLNALLMPLHHHLFIESNPIPIKWACQRIGLIDNGSLRLPLTPLTPASALRVEQALITANLL